MESVTFLQVGIFIGCVAFLVALAVGIKVLLQRDPPLHKEYVAKADHDKFRDEMTAELKRHAARRVEIYDEQKRQSVQLVRLETLSQQQGSDIAALKTQAAELQERVDAIPRRTIDLLIDAQRLAK